MFNFDRQILIRSSLNFDTVALLLVSVPQKTCTYTVGKRHLCPGVAIEKSFIAAAPFRDQIKTLKETRGPKPDPPGYG